MAEDTALTVQITADTGAAVAGIASVNTAFDALMAKINATTVASTASGATMVEAHVVAGAAAESHAAKELVFGESLGRVETAANSAARAASALGLSTEAALGRVEAFSGALEGLGKAALPLLAIGAAVLVVAEAFNFLKDGVDEAAKAQVAMASLGTAVRDQGGAWNDAAQSGVEKFLNAIEAATTYSRGEALEAINSLVTAGMSLADAEKTVAIATDVAAGSHRSLAEVVDALKHAEAGRGQGLIQLDEKLKPLIKSHAELSTVLTKLSEDFAGQAASAADTFAGKVEQLQNQLAHIGEELGEHLLPMLTTGAEILIGFAESAESHEPQIAHFFDTVIGGAERATRVLSDLGRMANFALAAATGNVQELMSGGQGAGAAAGDFGKLVGADFGGKDSGADSGNFAKFLTDAQNRAKADEAAADKILDGIRSQALQHDVTMGNPKASGSKTPFDFQAASAPTFEKNPDGDAEKRLDEQLKALTSTEDGYTRAVALATTTVGQHSAELAKAAAVTRDAQKAIDDIALVLDAEQKKLAAVSASLPEQANAWTETTNAYNAYGKAIGSSPSKAESEHLKDLKRAMDEASSAYKTSSGEVDKLNGLIDQNNTKLEESVKKLDSLGDALAAAARKENDLATAAGKAYTALIDAAIKSADAEAAREAVQVQNVATENALYGLSLQQQLAFYRQRYANELAASDQYTDQGKADFAKILSLEQQEYQQRLDAQKAFIASAQTLETSFIDDVLTKHQSLRDTLHSLFANIEADFVKMIEQMILKSALLNGLNSQIEKLFNVGGGGSGGSASSGVGGLSSLFSGGGGSGGSTSPSMLGQDTPGSNPIVDLGGNSLLGLTGSSTGVSPSTGAGVADMSNAGGGGEDWGNAKTGSSLGTYLGDIGAGAGYGQIVAGLTGGNAGNGSIGGMLGGLAAAVTAANPLAGAALEIGGSLLGSLFGSKATPASSPDIFDTTNYGQGVANLTGQMAGANGQYFYSNVEQQTGGKGEIAYIEEALAGATKITSGSQAGWYTTASGQQINPQQYQQLVNAFGVSATGSGQLNYGHNIGQQWVTGAQGASTNPESYSQLDALAASFLSSSGGAAAAIPVFSVGRTYPNMNLGTLNPDGTYTQSGTGTTTIPTGSTKGTTSSGNTTTGTGNVSADAMNGSPIERTLPGGVVIHINNPTFLTSKDMQATTDALAQAMAKSLARYGNGQLAGGVATRTNRSGNF